MNPGITDVASYLAVRIPTGADDEAQAVSDWRTTLYNARATGAMRPLTELVRRSVPEDEVAAELCEELTPKR